MVDIGCDKRQIGNNSPTRIGLREEVIRWMVAKMHKCIVTSTFKITIHGIELSKLEL